MTYLELNERHPAFAEDLLRLVLGLPDFHEHRCGKTSVFARDFLCERGHDVKVVCVEDFDHAFNTLYLSGVEHILDLTVWQFDPLTYPRVVFGTFQDIERVYGNRVFWTRPRSSSGFKARA